MLSRKKPTLKCLAFCLCAQAIIDEINEIFVFVANYFGSKLGTINGHNLICSADSAVLLSVVFSFVQQAQRKNHNPVRYFGQCMKMI